MSDTTSTTEYGSEDARRDLPRVQRPYRFGGDVFGSSADVEYLIDEMRGVQHTRNLAGFEPECCDALVYSLALSEADRDTIAALVEAGNALAEECEFGSAGMARSYVPAWREAVKEAGL